MADKCSQSLNLWIADEEQRIKKKPGQSSFYNSLLGLAGSVAGEYLSSQYDGFNLLDSIRRDVSLGISSPNGAINIAANVLTNQKSSLDNLASEIEFAQLLAQNLQDVSNSQPDYIADKAVFNIVADQLRSERAKFGDTPAADNNTPNQIQNLVDSGFIDQNSADNFSDSNQLFTSSNSGRKIQVVNEIRDRYYTIDPINYSNISNNLNENSIITIEDKDGNVLQEVYSSEGAGTIDANGTITIPTNEGNISFELTINNQPPSNLSGRRPNVINLKDEIVFNIPFVRDEFKYEVWACVLLDMLELLISKFDLIHDAMSLVVQTQNNLSNLKNISSKLAQSTPESLLLLDRIQQSINDIISNPIELGTNTLGITNIFSAAGFLGNNLYNSGITVCDLNKQKYCAISNDLQKFLDQIQADLDLIDANIPSFTLLDDILSELNLGDLPSIFESIISQIESIQESLLKLKSEFCYMIFNKIKGVPKSMSKVLNAISLLSIALIAIPSLDLADLGLSPSISFIPLIARLKKAGYTMGAQYLAQGDFLNFFLFDPAAGNHASQFSDCLDDYSSNTKSQRRSIAMQNLSRTSSARGSQAVNSQRVRESAQRRFNGNSNPAKATKDKAAPIIMEIKNEQ